MDATTQLGTGASWTTLARRMSYGGRKARSASRKWTALGRYCQRIIESRIARGDLKPGMILLREAFPLSLPRGGVSAMCRPDGKTWGIHLPGIFF